MHYRHSLALVALTVLAVACWPAFIRARTDEALPLPAAVVTAAPIPHDEDRRDALVAFWEGAVRERHPNDMLSPRQLAGQYLQRYRERGDIDDVIRARAMVARSLAIEPHSIAALGERAAIELTLHEFRPALRDVNELVSYDPGAAQFLAQRASLQMELGAYGAADASLRAIRASEQRSAAAETVRARYDELTGRLAQARTLLADAMLQADAHVDEPAQSRAWYHMRAGELAFAAGDIAIALADEHQALTIFPADALAFKDLARFELAAGHPQAALEAAAAGARITPFAETLGYESDAQAAVGDLRGADVTRAMIFAIERIGNAYHVNDRLLAMYYADHHLRPAAALAIAEREAAARGDEIYAQDTLAWSAASAGRWDLARTAARNATRFETQDPLLQYHAGIIALHTGAHADGIRRLRAALALNPHFHPTYADEARRLVARG